MLKQMSFNVMFEQYFMGNTLNNTCGSVNIIYYLRFNIWNKKETYIEITVRAFMLGSNSESIKTYQIAKTMIQHLNIQDIFLVVVEKWLNERTI